MTDYEIQDLLSGIGSNITELTALFVTVFIAYVVCMHLVGMTLTKFQVIAITSAHSIVSMLLVFLIVGNLNRITMILEDARGVELDIWASPYIVGPAVIFFTWMISIVFMLQVRRKGGLKDSADDT